MLKLALEGAGFISAYDRIGIRRSFGVTPPEPLDETAGRAIAVNQGVGVVLAGGLTPRRRRLWHHAQGYRERHRQRHRRRFGTRRRARTGFFGAATTLGNRVRTALGDDTSDSAQRFATDTLSATSLDVVREYATAMQALSNSQFDEARAELRARCQARPNFGLAYAGMAIASPTWASRRKPRRYVAGGHAATSTR